MILLVINYIIIYFNFANLPLSHSFHPLQGY